METPINLEARYKTKVIEIWQQFKGIKALTEPNKEYRKSPLLPKTIKTNSLLCIGLNPSFTEGNTIQEFEKEIGFYNLNTESNIKDIQYFEKFRNVANYCNVEWTHLDLFFIRETNQDVIKQMTYDEIPFLTAQLEISFEIIRQSNPKLILVANSLASEFFGKMKQKHAGFDRIWQGFDFFFENDVQRNKESTFDSSIGTYRIPIGGKKIPILFSSMLSGQRAMDIGSFERLKWQIKMILDGKSVK